MRFTWRPVFMQLKLALLSYYPTLKKDFLPLKTKSSKATTTSTTKQFTNKTSQEMEEILTQETVKQDTKDLPFKRQSRNELWDTLMEVM